MWFSDFKTKKFGDFKRKKFGATGTFKKGNSKFKKDKKFENKSATVTPEKKDWNKLKKDKKELKLKRKQTKDLFELTVQGKKIYEKLKWLVYRNNDSMVGIQRISF